MPFHGTAGFSHRATLWRRIGTMADSRPVVSDVAEGMDCRWDATRRVIAGQDGNPIQIDATVSVDREIPVGSAMWRGDPDDLPGTGQTPERDVMEVVTYEEDWDFRGMEAYREVTLIRAGETLPSTGTEPES